MHELEVLLSRLKMEHLSYHVESLLEQAAKKELNYREFLCMALQQEWNGRHQRGMESRLKQARLPWVKTLEQFDFTFQPGIDRKVVRELAGLAFVERSENVILLGPPGVGKTHLAIALGVKAVDAGHRVLFMPLDRLIATLMKAKQENRLERQLQQLSYARVCASGISAALSAPGGFAGIAAIPVDLTQYYAYLLRMAQKLLYLYGFPQIDTEETGEKFDDGTMNTLILCFGVTSPTNGSSRPSGAWATSLK